jgi:predicted MFS family arabinose efflux permease
MPPLILAAALLEGLSLTLLQGYLPIYLRQSLREAHFVTLGAIVAAPALGTVVASNFWGGVTDVSGRLKPVILVGLAGYALALAGLPLLRSGLGVLIFIGAASLLYGTLAPSLKTYVTLAQPDRPEHALARLLMSQSSGWFLGSVGGSWLLGRGVTSGLRIALWTCAALVAVHCLVSTRSLRDLVRPPAPVRDTRGVLQGVLADLASLYENPRLLRLCAIAFFCISGNYVCWGFFSVYFTEHLHADLGLLGVTLGVSSLAGILSFLYVGTIVKRIGGAWALAIGTSAYVVMYAGVGLSRDPVIVAALFALPVYGLIHVSTNTLASRYASAAQRGGGLGVLNGTYALASVVGPLTGGLIADARGLGSIPWTSAAFLTVAAALAWAGRVAAAPAEATGEEMRVDAG